MKEQLASIRAAALEAFTSAKDSAELDALRTTEALDKVTFGSRDLVEAIGREENVESITFLGLCTDICVISNVLLTKAFYPEIPLSVDAKGCAGVTPESHRNALEAMKMCQVTIENED
jgi:nicotinamidase-related amidase